MREPDQPPGLTGHDVGEAKDVAPARPCACVDSDPAACHDLTVFGRYPAMRQRHRQFCHCPCHDDRS